MGECETQGAALSRSGVALAAIQALVGVVAEK